jgi:hypothetical protein
MYVDVGKLLDIYFSLGLINYYGQVEVHQAFWKKTNKKLLHLDLGKAAKKRHETCLSPRQIEKRLPLEMLKKEAKTSNIVV